MPAQQGTVRYRQHDDAVTFRVAGRATMTQSLPMRTCAERLVTAGAAHVRIDLRDCTHADSTFVGTLLALDKYLRARAGRLTLVMPSLACDKILEQMGLGELLTKEAGDADDGAEWTDLAATPPDPATFRRGVTEAHEELAGLPGPAGEKFKAVIRCIEQSARTDKPPSE